MIVGCGAAGTLLAANLLRSGKRQTITVVERTGDFGPGLAYSTSDDLHLLNVPVATLSAFSEAPDHFYNWAKEKDPGVEPGDFLPRRLYGDYLRDVLAEAERIGAKRGNRIERLTDEVISIESTENAERVLTASGGSIEADDVVLAIGGAPYARQRFLPSDRRIFDSPWQEGALDDAEGTVLLIGNGLTAVDATLSLCWANQGVEVISTSRTGLRPFSHLDGGLRPPASPPAWPLEELTASDLRRTFCRRVQLAEGEGLNWRDVVDGIRPQIPTLWRRLGFDEQRRFLAESAREWEIRRHRMAPKVATRLETLGESGRTRDLTAKLSEVTPKTNGIDVVLTDTYNGATSNLEVSRIISCTGPGSDITQTGGALIDGLLASGRAVPDAHRLGISTSVDAEVLGLEGRRQPNLHLIGPLRRGDLWETTAIVEIRQQAEGLARKLRRNL